MCQAGGCILRTMGDLVMMGKCNITDHFSSTSVSSLPVERPKDNSNSKT